MKVGQKIIIPESRSKKTDFNFSWPTEGEVITYFGENINTLINNGLNIRASANNTEVCASGDGKVIFCNYLKGWGKTVILEHNLNFHTIYANLENTLLQEGNLAKKAQVIGKIASGKNGNYILHFEIRKKSIPQDPLMYLN